MGLTLSTVLWNMKRLILVSALIPCAAGAENWHQVFADYEYIVSVDADNIELSNGLARVWVRQHFLKERHSGDYAYDTLNGLNSFDCKNKKVRLLQVDIYQDGKAVESHKSDEAGGDRPIIPGTAEYFAYQYLCVLKKR